jgi:pyruvate dehydrogenase E2 component (dihydrolipoamide acetyltransferase)
MKIFNLPDLGEGLAEAEIVRWHVNAGDYIKADDPMLAVETAKAIVEVPAPFSGVIKATHGKPGDTVATGALLVEFETDATGSDPADRTSTPAPGATTAGTRAADTGTVVGTMPTSDEDYVEASISSGGGNFKTNAAGSSGNTSAHNRVRAVPAARALAQRLSIDIAQIRGTGRGELVTVDDVLQMAGAGHPRADASAAHTTGERLTNSDVRLGTSGQPDRRAEHAANRTGLPGNAADSRRPFATAANASLSHVGTSDAEKLRGPRRAMAHSMANARDNVVGCTLFDDADLNDWHAEQDITSRILRAIAEGCAAEPGLNAWFDGEALTRRIFSQIDVAIAVDTPEGLIVPVVRNIGGRPVAELRRDVDKLKRNTRERTVNPEDLRDFTFMLSNFGMIAGRYATPVVVPPAVAILGCGRLSHDVVATQSKAIEVHPRMPLSLTFDHRCVTGGEAARFLAAVIRDLQKGN